MNTFSELELTFPELEECEKQSTKGGTDNYSGWEWGSGGFGMYDPLHNGGTLHEVHVTAPAIHPPSFY